MHDNQIQCQNQHINDVSYIVQYYSNYHCIYMHACEYLLHNYSLIRHLRLLYMDYNIIVTLIEVITPWWSLFLACLLNVYHQFLKDDFFFWTTGRYANTCLNWVSCGNGKCCAEPRWRIFIDTALTLTATLLPIPKWITTVQVVWYPVSASIPRLTEVVVADKLRYR